MRDVSDWIARVAPTEGTILLTGETGVGKGMVAQAIHRASRRRDHPLVTLNCATIPEALLESELFGHRKGAFTGADSDQAGVVERAHHGTLFLDEIGDLPIAAQGHLLRFLETGEARRLGDPKPARFDVRIVAATNRPLSHDLGCGRFRQDLYFRLAVLHRDIPPLRARRDDVEALVAFWLPRLAQRHHHAALGIAPDALSALRMYDWPGNVRELRNVLERAVCLTSAEWLTLNDVTGALAPPSSDVFPTAEARPDMDATLRALQEHRGNQTRTARALGIDRTTLWRRLRRYGFGGRIDAR
jgi:DNA-binding NtrC family response regulator